MFKIIILCLLFPVAALGAEDEGCFSRCLKKLRPSRATIVVTPIDVTPIDVTPIDVTPARRDPISVSLTQSVFVRATREQVAVPSGSRVNYMIADRVFDPLPGAVVYQPTFSAQRYYEPPSDAGVPESWFSPPSGSAVYQPTFPPSRQFCRSPLGL